MNVKIGDILFAHEKRLLVVYDPLENEIDNGGFPYLLINLDNFEVYNAFNTLESLGNTIKIDKILKEYDAKLIN